MVTQAFIREIRPTPREKRIGCSSRWQTARARHPATRIEVRSAMLLPVPRKLTLRVPRSGRTFSP